MARQRKVANLLGLALLALLSPGRPMHPYEMAVLLRRAGSGRDIRTKWGSLYTVVRNLQKHGFIEATGSSKAGRRPVRTSYAITGSGRAELKDWLRELVAVPEPECSRFQAALSVLDVLARDEVTALLTERVQALDKDIAVWRATLAQTRETVARVFLIEAEYAVAMREAEAVWLRSLLTQLGSPDAS